MLAITGCRGLGLPLRGNGLGMAVARVGCGLVWVSRSTPAAQVADAHVGLVLLLLLLFSSTADAHRVHIVGGRLLIAAVLRLLLLLSVQRVRRSVPSVGTGWSHRSGGSRRIVAVVCIAVGFEEQFGFLVKF